MNRADLITRLQSQLNNNAGNRLNPSSYEAAVNAALQRFSLDVANQKSNTLVISADVARYDAPPDLLELIYHDWQFPSSHGYEYLNNGYPDLRSIKVGAGYKIEFYPKPPNFEQINYLGDVVNYHYKAAHYLSANAIDVQPCTIPDELSTAFELLVMSYLMLDIANLDVTSPIQLHNGMGEMQQPRTAIDQHRALLKAYKDLIDVYH